MPERPPRFKFSEVAGHWWPQFEARFSMAPIQDGMDRRVARVRPPKKAYRLPLCTGCPMSWNSVYRNLFNGSDARCVSNHLLPRERRLISTGKQPSRHALYGHPASGC